MRVLLGVLCGAALTTACASYPLPTQPNSTDAALAAQLVGGWIEQGLVVGSSFTMHLASQDTTLMGTGHYAIEAGRSGTLTVIGVVNGQMVHLDVVYDDGTQVQFDGTLSGPSTLKGSMHFGPPQSLTPSFLTSFLRTLDRR